MKLNTVNKQETEDGRRRGREKERYSPEYPQ